MTVDLDALKASYYEYIAKVPSGVQTIIAFHEQQQFEQVFHSLANLAEGVEALYIIEQAFEQKGYETNSRLNESIRLMDEISHMLQEQSFDQLDDILQELSAIFVSGTEWTFSK